MHYNGWVYETFGISKRFPIKPLQSLLNVPPLKLALPAKCFIYLVCALNGKFNKSSFIMLSFIKESPEGASPLCTGVTPGSISKWQGGLG